MSFSFQMAQICRLYNDLRLAARTTESSKNLIFFFFRVPDKSFTKPKRKNLMHACVHTYTEHWQSRKTAKEKKKGGGSSRYKSGEGDDVGKDPVGGVQSSAHMELHPLLLSTVVGETEIAIRLFTKKKKIAFPLLMQKGQTICSTLRLSKILIFLRQNHHRLRRFPPFIAN